MQTISSVCTLINPPVCSLPRVPVADPEMSQGRIEEVEDDGVWEDEDEVVETEEEIERVRLIALSYGRVAKSLCL